MPKQPEEICPFWNDEEFQEAFKEWWSMPARKKKGCAMTPRAINTALVTIMQESKGIKEDAIILIDLSANAGWTSFYSEALQKFKKTTSKPETAQTEMQKRYPSLQDQSWYKQTIGADITKCQQN